MDGQTDKHTMTAYTERRMVKCMTAKRPSTVMLKDASNANNGYVATGKIKRSKGVVCIVCV